MITFGSGGMITFGSGGIIGVEVETGADFIGASSVLIFGIDGRVIPAALPGTPELISVLGDGLLTSCIGVGVTLERFGR
jgi:hypothetical protein